MVPGTSMLLTHHNDTLGRCELANGKITQYTYLFIPFSFSRVLYTFVHYDCFRFVCSFESFCLNNCKMNKSKQRTLFEYNGFFAKTKKWEGTDTVVVSGRLHVKCCY